jgi:hypothetical protein
MPTTPKRHFDDDISRAESLVLHARSLPAATDPERLLRDDVLRSAWMFAVGAMDAYFCDAYVHCLTTTLHAKSIQANVNLPPFVKNVKIPIGSILSAYANRPNWKWRMAVRDMMERDNVLQLDKVTKLFNPFLPDGQNKKLFTEVIDIWLQAPGATAHLFGITRAQFGELPAGQGKDQAKKEAFKHFTSRITSIIQRRHDCIHNCDRPKSTPQLIGSTGSVRNVIRDVRFLVNQCDRHVNGEFPAFLTRIGCNAVTRNRLGY